MYILDDSESSDIIRSDAVLRFPAIDFSLVLGHALHCISNTNFDIDFV
jgi:hypothetical protein